MAGTRTGGACERMKCVLIIVTRDLKEFTAILRLLRISHEFHVKFALLALFISGFVHTVFEGVR
jgi:hypothetical protein